jgi:hypothetical protein
MFQLKELFLQTGWESRPAQGVPELAPREVRVDLTTFGQTRHASKTWLLSDDEVPETGP